MTRVTRVGSLWCRWRRAGTSYISTQKPDIFRLLVKHKLIKHAFVYVYYPLEEILSVKVQNGVCEKGNSVEVQLSSESDFLSAVQTRLLLCSHRDQMAPSNRRGTWLIVFLKSPKIHVDQMYKLPWAFENPKQLKQTFWSLLLKSGANQPLDASGCSSRDTGRPGMSFQSCRDVPAKTVLQQSEL